MRNAEAKMTAQIEEIPSVRAEITLTQRLRAYFEGDPGNVDALLREILPKLREVAARELHRERHQAPVSPTELIHEIWLRNLSKAGWTIRDRGHFYAIASLAMRRVLTDMARKRLTERRNGEEPMPANASSLMNATERDARKIVEIGILMDRLDEAFPDSARVVDMHYFAGFTFKEIAETNNLTVRQVRLRWEKGIKWLKSIHSGTSGG
jgi:RNA polymerase sigma factor (TIGR02999 family)